MRFQSPFSSALGTFCCVNVLYNTTEVIGGMMEDTKIALEQNP